MPSSPVSRFDFDEMPSAPRPAVRSLFRFEDGQLPANAPLLPMLSDEEEEVICENDQEATVMLQPRLSPSIFRPALASTFGISIASSICDSMDEDCPSLASLGEESSETSDDDYCELETYSLSYYKERDGYKEVQRQQRGLPLMCLHQQTTELLAEDNVVHLRPRFEEDLSSLYSFQ